MADVTITDTIHESPGIEVSGSITPADITVSCTEGSSASVVLAKNADELSAINAAILAINAAKLAESKIIDIDNKADKDDIPQPLNNLEIDDILV